MPVWCSTAAGGQDADTMLVWAQVMSTRAASCTGPMTVKTMTVMVIMITATNSGCLLESIAGTGPELGPVQADGTLDSLLSSTQWLTAALDVLCGAHKVRREADDGVREALAEAVLLLVCPSLHTPGGGGG